MKTYVRKSRSSGIFMLWVPIGNGKWFTMEDNGKWRIHDPPDYIENWHPCPTRFDVYEANDRAR